MKNISLLGSTGSIGTQTLEIIRDNRDFKVRALAAGQNIGLLEKQAREFLPELVCVFDAAKARELKTNLLDTPVKVVQGMDGLFECATEKETELVVTAMVGMIGIRPTIAAIEAGKDIALANKETLVTAGHIIMPLVEKHKIRLLPVDSEHSAIFQSLEGSKGQEISRILLTASGGPFRGKKKQDLSAITPKEALKHPNWSMGRKITIDSATMVNKGLEIIEASWLFDIEAEKIEVLVHPQSILHSAVEFKDGSVLGQMGLPDMKLPIQYALTYPNRRILPGKKLNFYELGSMSFEEPDLETFFGLRLAYEVLKIGGSMPAVYNAANEMAVALFLEEKIGFLEIPALIEAAVRNHKRIEYPDVFEILKTESETYEYIKSCVKSINSQGVN